MKSHVFGFALLSATIFACAPAQAQSGSLTRSFVSSTGVDTNPCTVTAPCATFERAYSMIGENGIIAALDPGKYGPLPNIVTGVTVNGNGWAAITAPAQGVGITDNGPGNVTLIGLEIDGAGAAYNGIVVNSTGSLTVENCTLQNFIFSNSYSTPTGNGILLQTGCCTLNFTITNTTASEIVRAASFISRQAAVFRRAPMASSIMWSQTPTLLVFLLTHLLQAEVRQLLLSRMLSPATIAKELPSLVVRHRRLRFRSTM